MRTVDYEWGQIARAGDVEAAGVVGIVVFGLGDARLALLHEFSIIEIAQVRRDAVVAVQVGGRHHFLAAEQHLEELLAVAGADDVDGVVLLEQLAHRLGQVGSAKPFLAEAHADLNAEVDRHAEEHRVPERKQPDIPDQQVEGGGEQCEAERLHQEDRIYGEGRDDAGTADRGGSGAHAHEFAQARDGTKQHIAAFVCAAFIFAALLAELSIF